MDLSKSKPAPADRIEDRTNQATGEAILRTIIGALQYNTDPNQEGIAGNIADLIGRTDIPKEWKDSWTGKMYPAPDPKKPIYSDKDLADMYYKDFEREHIIRNARTPTEAQRAQLQREAEAKVRIKKIITGYTQRQKEAGKK